MGWTMHFYSNVARNYGCDLTPADTLDDFPGLSTLYLRLPWAYLEPEEGKYNWAVFDTPAQRWIAKGKRIALRVTCSENWMTYATPKWVMDAGAKGVFYQYGRGRVDSGGAWDPFFDDPVFIGKLDAFLAAFAKRYDGNPNVEFVDVGTFGLWGEGHTHASFMSIHAFPKEYLTENRDMIDRVNQRMGYRIMPVSVTWPGSVTIATPRKSFAAYKDLTNDGGTENRFKVRWSWVNKGVAQCYPGGHPTLTLKDVEGGIVAVLVDETLNLRDLKTGKPGEAPVSVHESEFITGLYAPTTRPGRYALYLSVGRRDGTPEIALPLADDDGQRRYKIGQIDLAARDTP